jgi:hypothetical protein
MGNALTNNAGEFIYEHELSVIYGYIALNASSDVIGFVPTTTAPGAGPFTRAIGMQKSIGPAGSIILQPHANVFAGTVTLTNGSASITFSGNQTLPAGTWLSFSDQPSAVYQLASAIAASTAGTLTTVYTGTGGAGKTAVPGVYVFTFDEPWFALSGVNISMQDLGAAFFTTTVANVRSNTTDTSLQLPGTNTVYPTTTTPFVPQTMVTRFYSATATPANPTASSAFWQTVQLKRTQQFA